MGKQKSKKRIIRYIVIVETDTEFKETVMHRVMTEFLPNAFKGFYKGKTNKITVNKLKL